MTVRPGARTSLTIRTPEGVVFDLPLAGPVTRFVGWLLDFVIVALICMVANWLLVSLSGLVGGVALLVMYLIWLAVTVGYGMLFEWLWRGQTPGKKMVRLRVIDATGLELSGSQIVVRNLLRPVDALPLFYFVGGVACALGPRCQRLGDLAAGTVVVRVVRERVPEVGGVLRDKYNSFRDYPHLEARLRQRSTPDEAQVVLAAVARRDRLGTGDRLALYAELVSHFRAKVAFPDEAVHGLTDEQYLRNVVDTLFRARTGSAA